MISIEREKAEDPKFYVGTHFIPDDFIMDNDFFELTGLVFYRNAHYCTMTIDEHHGVIMDSAHSTPFIVKNKDIFFRSTTEDLVPGKKTYKMDEVVVYMYTIYNHNVKNNVEFIAKKRPSAFDAMQQSIKSINYSEDATKHTFIDRKFSYNLIKRARDMYSNRTVAQLRESFYLKEELKIPDGNPVIINVKKLGKFKFICIHYD